MILNEKLVNFSVISGEIAEITRIEREQEFRTKNYYAPETFKM